MEKKISELELKDKTTVHFCRLIVPDELDSLKNFILQLPEEDQLSLNINKNDEETIDEFLYYIKKGRHICITAKFDDGKIAGFTMLKLPKWGWMRKIAEIQGAVKPEYRKKGIAKKLLNSIFQASLTENIQTLVISVIEGSPDVKEALGLLGFKKHTVIKGFAQDIVDRKKDLIIYNLDVNEFWSNIAFGKQFGRSMED